MTVRMTASVTAQITSNGLGVTGNPTNPQFYNVNATLNIFDDTIVQFSGGPSGFFMGSSNPIQVSLTLRAKEADAFIRQTIANRLFAGTLNVSDPYSNTPVSTSGLIIDPDDIYIAMTS